jgi:hypothetical protein
MVPHPVAVGMMFCDSLIVEEGTRKVSFIGSFNRLNFDGFPSPQQPFYVLATLTEGHGRGRIDAIVSRLDTDEEIYTHRGQITFSNPLQEVTAAIRLQHCSFPEPGMYQVTLLIDGEWVAHRRLRIRLTQEQS